MILLILLMIMILMTRSARSHGDAGADAGAGAHRLPDRVGTNMFVPEKGGTTDEKNTKLASRVRFS